MDATLGYQWWNNHSVNNTQRDLPIFTPALSYRTLSVEGEQWFPALLSSITAFSLTLLLWIVQGRHTSQELHTSPKLVSLWIPWIGTTLDFYSCKLKFAAKMRDMGRGGVPLQLRLFNRRFNLISGHKHVSAVWRSKVLDNKPEAVVSLSTFFKSPAAATNTWANDTSGGHARPHPKSTTTDEDRIYYHTHRTSHATMNGSMLKGFARRFQGLYEIALGHTRIDGEWTEMNDLYSFVQTTLSTAAVEALCGPVIIDLHPNFIEDFWLFDGSLPKFFGGFPRITAPSAYKARARCLQAVKDWHAYARANFDESSIDTDGHDPYWGATFMRARQEMWSKMKTMDADGCASEDLGILWGENSNSIPGAFWCLTHVLRTPGLLARVRSECMKCVSESTPQQVRFDADKLKTNPLLQSIWAEVMRMYIAAFLLRASDHDDFQLDEQYTIKRGELIVIDTWTAHHDSTIWNEGTLADPHPLTEFWADRFLIYPEDATSGPVKTEFLTTRPKMSPQDGPLFSTTGLAGSFIPFGGGRHACPGQQFAKQEMMLCLAMMVTMFDIELDLDTKFEPDWDYFGLGALPFKGMAPCRIRRRQWDEAEIGDS